MAEPYPTTMTRSAPKAFFDAVAPGISFPQLDRACLDRWRKAGTVERALAQGDRSQPYIFYEGPPTANGMPHPGHVLTRVMKDAFLRYHTMLGQHVPRRAGWDTHGLPVEVEVEKDLGISGRHAIETYGVEAFTRRCIESVFRYVDAWRAMSERIGFWIDLDDAYVTFHQSYVESVWWALAELHRKGLLYQDYKVVWWWPQGGTALSAGEVGQGYKTTDDPAVTVRFPLDDFLPGVELPCSLLAWTTTPWTLPSNVGLAVMADESYALVRLSESETDEILVVASARLAHVFGNTNHSVVGQVRGAELVGRHYRPAFAFRKPETGDPFRVIAADFVTLDSGTGIVHLAPAFGEDDFRAAKEHNLGFLQMVDADGRMSAETKTFAGVFCKDADKAIIAALKSEGRLFASERIRHDYPFCWRRDSDPLIQYARKSWFVRTTRFIDRVIANNTEVQWQPEHIREGRFGSFLRNNVDWALSRERFWGTPLPLWINDQTGSVDIVSSVDEILERNPHAFDRFDAARQREPQLSEHLRVHRPWIDAVTWTKPNEPGTYRRVPEVIDCWFDSGCMPFAQWGYPHKKQREFLEHFPADFITEAVDQTRGWFYSLICLSTVLFDQETQQETKQKTRGDTESSQHDGSPAAAGAFGSNAIARPQTQPPHPYRNCLVLGLISDAKGQKLSKSKKNYTDPMELMEAHGADAVRWSLYANTVPGQGTRYSEQAALASVREFLLKIWNVYSFFVTYANIDGWHPAAAAFPPVAQRSELDRWILAEWDDTIGRVRQALDTYRSHVAVRAIEGFVDALSNWYVRRSRDRFWSAAPADHGGWSAAEGDSSEQTAAQTDSPQGSKAQFADKHSAFCTLHETLAELSRLIAPFVPFVADTMYRNLVAERGNDTPNDELSVHLAPYPEVSEQRSDPTLQKEVTALRAVVALGQRIRTEHKLKVRQPLAKAIVFVTDAIEQKAMQRLERTMAKELNIHAIEFTDEPQRYVRFAAHPNFRALGPRLGKRMRACQSALRGTDGAEIYAALRKQGRFTVEVEGDALELGEDEIELRVEAQEGYAAAADRGRIVILDTRVTTALHREGLAREVVNRIQRKRKELDLPFEARIELLLATPSETLREAIEQHRATVAGETLARSLRLSPQTLPSEQQSVLVEDYPLYIIIQAE